MNSERKIAMRNGGESTRRLLAMLSIFLVAVGLRLSSCYESFWIDELHTSWVIDGDLSQVASRAAMGNQMPFYFWGLWCWKTLVGDGEFSLRLSSVLCVALAGGCLGDAVIRQTRSLWCGWTSGMVLAVEQNAMFFGTELRPYAVIVLAAVFAWATTLSLLRQPDRPTGRRWVLTVCLVGGILVQPTSLGVLGWIPAVLLGHAAFRRRSWRPQFSISVLAQGCTVVAACLWAWQFTLRSSWQIKENWAVFAVPTWIGPFWNIWPWWTLIGVPLLAAAAVTSLFRRHKRGELATAVLLASLALSITFVYWLIAYAGWVPLWHRRYFIGVLPLLAAVPGFALAQIFAVIHGQSRWQRLLPPVLSLLMVGGLLLEQRTWFAMLELPKPLVVRGEAWREALTWLDEQRDVNDRVFVDAGLIESRQLHDGLSGRVSSSLATDYLTLPMRGLYRWEDKPDDGKIQPIGRNLLFPLGVLGSPDQAIERVWIITRRPIKSTKRALRASIRRTGPFDYQGVRVTSFGNVTVAEVPRLIRRRKSTLRSMLFGW